jgi:hypothetical protein
MFVGQHLWTHSQDRTRLTIPAHETMSICSGSRPILLGLAVFVASDVREIAFTDNFSSDVVQPP